LCLKALSYWPIWRDLEDGPKNLIPSFILGITSVIQHRF